MLHLIPHCRPVVGPGTPHWRLCWTMNGCVPRWTVGGQQNLTGTRSCQSVLLHPTLHPTPRWGLQLQTHHLRSVPGNSAGTCQSYSHAGFIISAVFFPPPPRVWSLTPSQHSTCPCSRSKSSHTRSAPTRGPHPWTGPRKTNSSATYRTSHLVHSQVSFKVIYTANFFFNHDACHPVK